MKTTAYIKFTIDRLPKGYVFTYADLVTEVGRKEAVIKALNRLVIAGKIAKLSKGKYYKPEDSAFGKLQPHQAQVVKDLLEENGKTKGYLTGYSIYNQMGLTTQVSNTIQIGKNQIRPSLKRERYTISFVKQKNIITKENIPYLQLLDAIRYIKKIPGSSVESTCKRILAIIKSYSNKEIHTLVRLALKYPPASRAVLGSFLDELKKNKSAQPLFNSLNPITKYKIAGITKVISTAGRWNIK